MSKDDLKNKIIQKIHQEKPHSYWRFWITDFLRILTIIVLLIGAGLSLAYFIWDSLEANKLANFEGLNIWMMLMRGLPEILVIVFLVSVLLYVLYRQTDLPFVKNRTLVFSAVWVILAVLCSGLIVFVQNSKGFERIFTSTQESLENLPYRPRRFHSLYEQGRQEGQFKGRVIEISPLYINASKIIIANPFETKTFIVPDLIVKDIRISDSVLIETDLSDPHQVIEIHKLPPRPFDPLLKPEKESVILFSLPV